MKTFSLFILSLLISIGYLSGADWNVQIARYKQKFCVHGIIGARQTGASNEHEHQTQFS